MVLVAGAASHSPRQPFLNEMRERFGSARLEVVPGASHFLPMERPEAVAAVGGALLGREAAAGGR